MNMIAKKILSALFIIGIISTNIIAQSNETFAYEFKVGEKYHIFQYRANIRENPRRDSAVIAVLSINDKIEIIENSLIVEKINRVWGFWYKIKYGNIIGYTFGGNISINTLITDIDKNGMDDYFHFRCSNENLTNNSVYWQLDSYSDVIVYINNKQINTNMMDAYYMQEFGPVKDTGEHIFNWCEFKEMDEYVNINLIRFGKDNYKWTTVYKINKEGNIDFVEYITE
jgi:hypothetical protein